MASVGCAAAASGIGSQATPPRPAVGASRSFTAWAPRALLLVVPVVVFARVVSFDFVIWDDPANVTQNRYLDPLTTGSLLRFWRAPFEGLYIPLTYSLWSLETLVSRAWQGAGSSVRFDPRVFHAGSLLLHLAAVGGVYAVLRRLVDNPLACACGGAVYSVHPLQVESVAWVTETKGLLAAALSWLAVWLYLERRDRPLQTSTAPHRFSRWWSSAAFVGALLAKPSAVVVPLFVVAIERWHYQASWRTAVAGALDWLLIAAAWVLLTRRVQPGSSQMVEVALWLRPFVAADAVAFYLEKLAWPWGLTADYGRAPDVALSTWRPYWAWIIPCALAGGVALLRVPTLKLAVAIFLAGLLPVLGLVSFNYQIVSTVADRYAYLAMFGPALAVAWGVDRWGRAALVAALASVAAMAAVSFFQSAHWRDSESLLAHMLAANPTSFPAHNNLGVLRIGQNRLDEAARHLEAAIARRPELPQPHVGLGDVRFRQGDIPAAEQCYRRALKADPRAAAAWAGLGHVAARARRYDEACQMYLRSLELNRHQPALANIVARIRAAVPDPAQRNAEEAIQWAQWACQLTGRRSPRTLETLAAAYAEAGDFSRACATIREAIDVAQAQGNAAYVRAGSLVYADFLDGKPLREDVPAGLP